MQIPPDVIDVMEQTWSKIEPHFQELAQRPLTPKNLEGWLSDWSHWSCLLYEAYQRLYIAITTDTNNAEIQQRYDVFVD